MCNDQDNNIEHDPDTPLTSTDVEEGIGRLLGMVIIALIISSCAIMIWFVR